MEKLKHPRGRLAIPLNVWTQDPPLVVDAETAPHSCANPKCPGNINRRKLEAAKDMADALTQCISLFTRALPKFNWGKSALDGEAIGLLNEVPGMVQVALFSWEKAEKGEE